MKFLFDLHILFTLSGSSNPLQFYCSISLGILISNLYQQQQFIEMISNNSYAHVLSSVNALENIVFNDELDKKEGACVGYSLAVASAAVYDFNKDSRYRAVQIRNRIMKKCECLPIEDLVTIIGQELFFGLAYLTMAMFLVDFVTIDEVIDCVKFMQEKAEHSSVGVLLIFYFFYFSFCVKKCKYHFALLFFLFINYITFKTF